MNQNKQILLLEEILKLNKQKSHFNDEEWVSTDTQRYSSDSFYEKELKSIFRNKPQIAAHCSELPEKGSFLTVEIAHLPVLITRDQDGEARAFLNVCRHRGARLVDDKNGCKKRFSCPYHAWTWKSSGELLGVPHQASGFPDMDKSKFALHQLQCQEFAGWIWLSCSDQAIDVKTHLGAMAEELAEMNSGTQLIFATETIDVQANWKILVEGGIESYHFKVAHRDTVGPLFLDNLSTYQCFDEHMRAILPRSSITKLELQDEENWDFRKHVNLVYTLFPGSQFLVQEDHFIWIQASPKGPDQTTLRLSTIIAPDDHPDKGDNYWQSHHDFTIKTLMEDFALAESIQSGISSGATKTLNFGRFEGALSKFNRFVDEAIST